MKTPTLTPKEIKSLRAEFKRDGEHLRGAFTERLTPEEIERLRDNSKRGLEAGRKAFAHLQPKSTKA